MSRYNQSRHLCTYCLTNVAASLPASMLMSGAKFYFDLVVTKVSFDTERKIIPREKNYLRKILRQPNSKWFHFEKITKNETDAREI